MDDLTSKALSNDAPKTTMLGASQIVCELLFVKHNEKEMSIFPNFFLISRVPSRPKIDFITIIPCESVTLTMKWPIIIENAHFCVISHLSKSLVFTLNDESIVLHNNQFFECLTPKINSAGGFLSRRRFF